MENEGGKEKVVRGRKKGEKVAGGGGVFGGGGRLESVKKETRY